MPFPLLHHSCCTPKQSTALKGNSWQCCTNTTLVPTPVSKFLLRSLQPPEHQKGKRKRRNTPNFTCMHCVCSSTLHICHISVCMLLSRDASETATKVTGMAINSSQGKHSTRSTMHFLRLYLQPLCLLTYQILAWCRLTLFVVFEN